MINPINPRTVPSVSITTARADASAKANELGMRTMQKRACAKRGGQSLLIKSPPASGKSRALMFIAPRPSSPSGAEQTQLRGLQTQADRAAQRVRAQAHLVRVVDGERVRTHAHAVAG